jgi:Zn-dependent protease
MLDKLLFKLNLLFTWRWEIFRLQQIPIFVDSSWILIFFVYTAAIATVYLPTTAPNYFWGWYVVTGIITVILFFSSVLAHELAHCYFARRAEIKIHNITLYLFGGLAHLSQEASHPWDEMKIAIAGPVANFFLALLFFCIGYLTNQINLLYQIFTHLSIVNFALACFNLLPGFPMDGGRLLRAIIWYYGKNYLSATQFSLQMGNRIAFVLITIGFINLLLQHNWLNSIWSIITGLFLIKLISSWGPELLKSSRINPPAWQSTSQVKSKYSISHNPTKNILISEIMDKQFDSIEPNLLVLDFMRIYSINKLFFLVIQDRRLHGILDYNMVASLSPDKQQKLYIKNVMLPVAPQHFLLAQASLAEAKQCLESNGIGLAAVLDNDGYVIGCLSKKNLSNH